MSFKTNTIFLYTAIAVISCFFLLSCQKNEEGANPKKVLVFSKTNGFRHESISAGINAIKNMGLENKFLVYATEDSLDINIANLNQYQVIIFLNTTGNVLGESQEMALQDFMQKGKGFVGVHSATDCEYEWNWYVEMIGANFLSHPDQQNARLIVQNSEHPSTRHLPGIWERTDEWYNFTNMNPDVTVLLEIDETSYTGGQNGNNHPMAWYHEYGGGKVFYTALGHTVESYSEPLFLQHLLGGITSVMGH